MLTGGGVADADAEDVVWVVNLQEWLRRWEGRRNGRREGRRGKIVGVCWGHEVVHVALGGRIGRMGEGGFEVRMF